MRARLKLGIFLGLVVYTITRPYVHKGRKMKSVTVQGIVERSLTERLHSLKIEKRDFSKARIAAQNVSRSSKADYCVTCAERLKCENWKPSNEILKAAESPLIATRPDKFLLPWLYNGPINQLYGFRQAIYVAVRLNRTLVMPVFAKHFIDAKEEYVDPNHRFEVAAITKLVRIVTLDEYLGHCGRRADVMFLSQTVRKAWGVATLEAAQRILDLDLIHDVKVKESSVVALDSLFKMPYLPTSTDVKYHVSSDRESIAQNFNSTASCAFYALPYREVDFPANNLKTENMIRDFKMSEMLPDSTKIPDRLLFGMITKQTNIPGYIKELAKLFIQRTFTNGKYLALHWRYDQKDFFKFQCTPDGNPQRGNKPVKSSIKAMCDRVRSIKPGSLAEQIHLYMKNNVTMDRHDVTTNLYVSTPRATLPWLMKNLKESTRLRFVNSEDLMSFLKEERVFSRCKFFDEYLSDLISLLDMEICTLSQVFFRSGYSTWSDNVSTSRRSMIELKYVRFDKKIKQLIDADGFNGEW